MLVHFFHAGLARSADSGAASLGLPAEISESEQSDPRLHSVVRRLSPLGNGPALPSRGSGVDRECGLDEPRCEMSGVSFASEMIVTVSSEEDTLACGASQRAL